MVIIALTILQLIKDLLTEEPWREFVAGPYQESKALNSGYLGGDKPPSGSMMSATDEEINVGGNSSANSFFENSASLKDVFDSSSFMVNGSNPEDIQTLVQQFQAISSNASDNYSSDTVTFL